MRYSIAWNAGLACGFTATRSPWRSQWKYSSVRIDTTDALELWCPPTLTPSVFGRTTFASWIIRTASHSTRSWICSRSSEEAVPAAAPRAGDVEAVGESDGRTR